MDEAMVPQLSPTSPLVRPARSHDAAGLAALAGELLRHEQSLNEQMGELAPWAATPDELRKQLQQPNTGFFVAEYEGELVGYLKAVVYGGSYARHELGWRLWLQMRLEEWARDFLLRLLDRPRPNVEAVGGYIAGAFVKPELRRSHIGHALVQAAESWLREQGMQTSELHVLYGNAGARQFWESLGYEPLLMGMRKSLTKE
jgi:GNAT superfamily N-acetyltransferase